MEQASNTSSIRVDRRESRSVANAAAQKIVSPFSSLILKPGDAQPPGSPQLTPPKNVQGTCSIGESNIANTWLYTFNGPYKSDVQVKHRIYYFAGGGFRGVPEKEHWKLCADLCTMLPEYEISLRLYDALAEQSRRENFRITLFGDSSGGNIAIVLGLYAASEYLKDIPGGPCPVETVMAMCPATDMRNENPEIDVVQDHDPILSRKLIEEVAEGWRAELPASDPRVSPILADLSVFKKAGIKVDGVTAGYDTLTPDAIKFREKLGEYGVDGDWLQWEKQMHCFPLLPAFHIYEGTAEKE
ncbi:Alpha/Beta hydrolase protein [Rhexocercosporidium sp. MPI-PUGE-AT-0058]|nr:Alpha/Beta hydrolase protein [Rhexocercosporidium sp. MPI-PUGE-AT-0058]